MIHLISKSILSLSALILMISCGETRNRKSEAKRWELKVGEEAREFFAHGCERKKERLYCLAGESEDPGAFPRLTFHLPLPLEHKEYTFQPAAETEAISCQTEHTGLIYRTSNESEPYFSCARGAQAKVAIPDSGDDFMEASISASLTNKSGNKLTISFEKIRFNVN